MNNILDITVSGFKNYMDNSPINVNLMLFLTSNKYQKEVEQIRTLTNKSQRDKLKATLPAITPSGLFATNRKDENLKQHSGFICIDIDMKGNENVNNYNDLKTELCKIPFVAFCGLSVSGAGYFVLIPIKETQYHKEYFNTLSIAFQDMNITIDKSCINVSRLRGYSYNPEPYINNNAKIWDYLPPLKEVKPQAPKTHESRDNGNSLADLQKWVTQTTGYDLIDGQKHFYIFWLSYAIRKNGISETEVYNIIYNNVLSQDQIKSNCILGGITHANNKGIYNPELNQIQSQSENKKDEPIVELIVTPNNNYKHIKTGTSKLKELIKMQWQKLNPDCWDLSKPYDLQVICEQLNLRYSLNISDEEYYNIYKSLH